MNKVLITLLTTMVALAALFCFMPGCEEDADTGGDALDNYFKNNPYVSDPRDGGDSPVKVDPTSASVTQIGEQKVFHATGGTGRYTWDTSRPGNGTMAVVGGNTAFAEYTAILVDDNDVIVYDGNGDAAIATITSGYDPLTVSPSTTTILSNDVSVVLTGTGGRSPYAWSEFAGATNLISLSANVGAQIVVSKDAGAGVSHSNATVTVELSDQDGQNAYATITLE